MKNLKIRTKLFVMVAFMLAVMIAIGVIGIVFMQQINNNTTAIADNWLPSTATAEEMNTLISDYRVKEYRHILSDTQEEMSSMETDMDALKQQMVEKMAKYETMLTNDEDKQLLANAKNIWNQYLEVHEKIRSYSHNNQTEQATEIMHGESKDLFDEMTSVFLKTVEFNNAGSEAANQACDDMFSIAMIVTIIILCSGVAVSLALAIYIMLAITRPVSEIDHVARKIADGKLNESIRYQSKDELGKLAGNFNKTVSRLRDYVNYIDEISSVLNEIAAGNLVFDLTYDYAGEFAKVKSALDNISASLNDTMGAINQAADQVSSGSDQVSSGAQALSQGATEQASSVQELAATINEISQQVKDNAENSQSASQKVRDVGGEMEESNQKMQEMIQAMSDISNSSKEIGKIIKNIEDIAFQTNILALNAAVEAARAGAAGKGFAVVADEVRNLASKSAEASKNTASLIEASIQSVENGNRIVDSTAESLTKAASGAGEVISLIERISNASTDQANSIAQVTQGVDQISNVVQTNSATAEQSAAASEELSGQAQMLKNLVSRFKLRNSGGTVSYGNPQEDGYAPQPSYSDFDGDSKY